MSRVDANWWRIAITKGAFRNRAACHSAHTGTQQQRQHAPASAQPSRPAARRWALAGQAPTSPACSMGYRAAQTRTTACRRADLQSITLAACVRSIGFVTGSDHGAQSHAAAHPAVPVAAAAPEHSKNSHSQLTVAPLCCRRRRTLLARLAGRTGCPSRLSSWPESRRWSERS